jgi:hypothetical protein
MDTANNASLLVQSTGAPNVGHISLYNTENGIEIGTTGQTPPARGLFIDAFRLVFNDAPLPQTFNNTYPDLSGNFNITGGSYIDVAGGVNGININNTGVNTLNSLVGQVALTSGNGLLTIAQSGNDLIFTESENPNFVSAYISTLTVATINGSPYVPGSTGPTGPSGGGGGSTGPTGSLGPTGAQGAAGQSSSYYPYQADNGTVPTTGHITWSNFTSQISSTSIRVNHIDKNSVDIDIFLSLIQQGNTLIIQDANVSANFQTWLVNGPPVYNVTDWEFPVALVTSGGSTNFANNHDIILAIIASPPGPTGPTGPGLTTSLSNRVIVNSVGTPSSTALTWSSTSVANQYVPLASDTSVSYKPPVSPITGTGWRFEKTYNLITVATSGLLISNTYSIVTPGTINWTAIGATASTAGTQFTYNGVAITGTGGTAVSTNKISWYSLNALYGLSLPQTVAPGGSFTKADLQNAWFLVKFNADIALQGSLAIQIDTYAYQYAFPGPSYPAYTGRWAYSFPLQQGVGFTAQQTTNITTGTTFPRLRAGFTYLLYAGDYSTVGLPGPYLTGSPTYLTGGAGLFPPSQALVANSLKDPFDIYPEFPHIGLTSCLYLPNAVQPTYGSPYTDPASVEVASIYLNTSSTAPYSGVGQTVTDFQVIDMGYTSTNGSFSFPLTFV